jgi:8-oxo-dGTP pyrophosphatase MutT (NUDIX family)
MKKSYGGVIINQEGQVLLREPAGHFGGYVWTFAKGEPNPGESIEATARREVLEETGIIADIVAKIPGVFRGDTTDNEYFLMMPKMDTKAFGVETKSVRWVSQGEAEELISKTRTSAGRARDLAVLKVALKMFHHEPAS